MNNIKGINYVIIDLGDNTEYLTKMSCLGGGTMQSTNKHDILESAIQSAEENIKHDREISDYKNATLDFDLDTLKQTSWELWETSFMRGDERTSFYITPCTPALSESIMGEPGICDCSLLPDKNACTLKEASFLKPLNDSLKQSEHNESFDKKQSTIFHKKEQERLMGKIKTTIKSFFED